eukprot:340627_1
MHIRHEWIERKDEILIMIYVSKKYHFLECTQAAQCCVIVRTRTSGQRTNDDVKEREMGKVTNKGKAKRKERAKEKEIVRCKGEYTIGVRPVVPVQILAFMNQ